MEDKLPEVGDEIIVLSTDCGCDMCESIIGIACVVSGSFKSGVFDLNPLNKGDTIYEVPVLEWKYVSSFRRQIERNYTI